ncbi:MAG: hypothetical protein AAGE52_28365 [Myxococcota bacterium]
MPTIDGPKAFWDLIERCECTFARLEKELGALDERGLENFHGLYSVLADDALIEDEIYYAPADLYLSEDGMEDFGWWVIPQGRAFFDALTFETMPLADALKMHMEGKPPRVWQDGGPRQFSATNFMELARAVFESRFGEFDYDRGMKARERAYKLRDAEYAQASR